MKKIMMAIVMMVSAGAGHASDFGSLAVGADILKAAAAGNTTPVEFVPVEKSAGDRLRGLPGETAFDKLKNLFEEGVPATQEDLTGWYAGRTVSNFYKTGKNRLCGALLAGRKTPFIANGGPLLGEEKVMRLDLQSTFTLDYYDNMNAATAARVAENISQNVFGFIMEFPAARGVVLHTTIQESVEERKARGYIVERVIVYNEKMQNAEERYSYYFKNVTPGK